MSYNVITGGPPNGSLVPFPAGAATVLDAIDTNTKGEWLNVGQGWQPVAATIAKATVLSTTAAQATLLVFTAPVSGVYQVTLVSSQATATNGTLPTATVTFTDADTSATVTGTVVGTGTATTGQGQSQFASTAVNAKAGTVITVITAAPTTLTANLHAFIGLVG